jgi:tetratricopeptide (TPR) repeat protein
VIAKSYFPARKSFRCMFLYLLLSSFAHAQRPLDRSQQTGDQEKASITASVMASDGSPYMGTLLVNLYNFQGNTLDVGTLRTGFVDFHNLVTGRYTIEVIAPGYHKLKETVDISIPGENQKVFLTLVPESSGAANPPSSAPPILTPNAQKELNQTLEALRANKPSDARKHLEKLSHSAAGNPDVNYLWGIYCSIINDWAGAKSYWDKAIQIYPHHSFSLSALAQVSLRNGDLPSAISYFERAVEAEPSSWRYRQHLAQAYLQNQDYKQAQTHAAKAIELGKDRAGGAQLILAQTLVQENDEQLAIRTLYAFLVAQPTDSNAAAARQLYDSLLKKESSVSAPPPAAAPQPVAPSSAMIAAELTPSPKWMPPDVDESMPAVEPGVVCPLQKVQDEAAKRVRDFVESVNKITATEKLYNELLNHSGFPAVRENRSYDYVVGIEEIRPGMFDVQEYRNGNTDPALFPQHIATIGLPSLVMVFHPDYKDDFEVSCEGLSRWGGGLAWQVHFRQRWEKPSRLRGYRVGGRLTPVSLRGRAWIAADTYQVVRLETDIVSPLPEIRLKAEHISVDYGPIAFRKYNAKLWLPQTAELYFDFNGRRMHRRHQFSNYLLFAVDEREKISDPKMPVDADPSASPSLNNF